MRKIAFVCMIVALCLGGAMAGSLDGKKISLKAGDVVSRNVPIAVKCDAPDLDEILTVVEPKTGSKAAATLRAGELVFICEGAMPNTEHRFTIKARPKKAEDEPKVLIKKRDDAAALDVIIEDLPFTTYHYSNDNKKPFLWPVLSEGGVGVTRDWPMQDEMTFIGLSEKDQERYQEKGKDHVHHKSLWVSYGDVNGADCWGEGDNSGYQHSGEVTFGSGDAYGWIKAKNIWQDKDLKPVVAEEREYRFYAVPEKGRLIDTFVTFTAEYGDVKFGDTKEGGIVAVRMRPELSYKWARITNSHGDKGESKCWGKPSPWCDYSGELGGVGWRGLAIFDHPSNLRYPTSWHVRSYGLNGANCFGYSYFSAKDYNKDLMPANGDHLLKEGETLSFTHRIYVHSGDVEKAEVASRYADFATPPQAAWVE